MFPRHAVGSVVGLGGFAGAVGGMLISTFTGFLLETTGSYVPVFMMAGSAYLLALAVVHLLAPRSGARGNRRVANDYQWRDPHEARNDNSVLVASLLACCACGAARAERTGDHRSGIRHARLRLQPCSRPRQRCNTSPSASTVGGGNPTSDTRVATFTVTFPAPGTYELYARLRVGAATFNDDSFYYGNGFGVKPVSADASADGSWILANGLAAPVGYTLPSDKVVGGGLAARPACGSG